MRNQRFDVKFDGRPIPYKRPMFRSRKNPKGTGSDKSNKQLEDLSVLVRKAIREQTDNWDSTKPIKVSVLFGFSDKKASGGRGRDAGFIEISVLQTEGYWTSAPDIDNVSKMVIESLQHGGAVKNDSQVVILEAIKVRDVR